MHGLELAAPGQATYQRLRPVFPPWEIPLNPFDAGVCMEFHLSDLISFFQTLTAIAQDENVDSTIMQMPSNFLASVSNNPDVPENMTATLKEQFVQWLISVKEYGKPFALWCSAMDRQEMELVEMLEAKSLPVFQSSERAVKAFSAMYRYGQRIGMEQK
jgi:acyl-CoA synthetase (NDP forming)